MKNKIFILVCALLSVSLIGFGVYGFYLDKSDEKAPEWISNLNNSVNKDSDEAPVDTEFNKMKQFSLNKDKDKNDKNIKLENDKVISGIVNPTERIKDNGKVESKGSPKNMSCSSLPNSHVYIPSTNTYSKITIKGGMGDFASNGELKLPNTPFETTRWTGGTNVKSKEGVIVLAAHRAYSGYYGVFNNLVKLDKGNIACVSDGKGNMKKFAIESLKSYDKDYLPQNIFKDAKTGEKRLVLITCGGKLTDFDNGMYSYSNNVVATFKEIK